MSTTSRGNPHELEGKTFGSLFVMGLTRPRKTGERMWTCYCSCGTVIEVRTATLVRGKSKSCGCRGTDKRSYGRNREKNIWRRMMQRCYSPRHVSYKHYGARGIRVCRRWRESFDNFLEDMGRAPSYRYTLDRKDRNKGYGPDNCKWSTPVEQAQHRSN